MASVNAAWRASKLGVFMEFFFMSTKLKRTHLNWFGKRFAQKDRHFSMQALIVMFLKKKTNAVINCTRFRTIWNSFRYFYADLASFLPKKKSKFQHTLFSVNEKAFFSIQSLCLCVFVFVFWLLSLAAAAFVLNLLQFDFYFLYISTNQTNKIQQTHKFQQKFKLNDLLHFITTFI